MWIPYDLGHLHIWNTFGPSEDWLLKHPTSNNAWWDVGSSYTMARKFWTMIFCPCSLSYTPHDMKWSWLNFGDTLVSDPTPNDQTNKSRLWWFIVTFRNSSLLEYVGLGSNPIFSDGLVLCDEGGSRTTFLSQALLLFNERKHAWHRLVDWGWLRHVASTICSSMIATYMA